MSGTDHNGNPISQFGSPPPQVWRRLGNSFERISTQRGKQSRRLPTGELVGGVQDTERQTLTGILQFTPYLFTVPNPDPDVDYYALDMHWEHGVDGYGYTKLYSAGYYCNYMELQVQALGADDYICEFVPNSTPGEQTDSFTIGLTLTVGAQGEDATGSAALSLSWTKSYTAPDTVFRPERSTSEVRWEISLPGDRYCIDGTDEPKPTATGNLKCDPQVIVRVRKGNPLNLMVSVKHEWHYMWPSQTIDDRKYWQDSFKYINGYYYIENNKNGLVMDISANDTSEGAKIGVWQCKGIDRNESTPPLNQLWYHSKDGQIVSALNGLCIDITKADTSNDVAVCMWPINGNANQKWSIDSDGQIKSALDGALLVAAPDGSVHASRNTQAGDASIYWKLVPMMA